MRGNGEAGGRRRTRLGWVVQFGAAALFVVVVANVAVVAAESRLPNPRRYLSPRTEQLVQDMDRLQAAGVRSDLLFVGTSQAARGVVPKVVGSELDLPWVGNVAIPGSQAPVTKRWTLEEVVPRLHPRCVVWGLSSIDLNGGRPDPSIDRYDAALATRKGVLGRADEQLAEVLPIARHRSQLRDPYKLGSELRTVEPPAKPPHPLPQLLGPVLKKPASEKAKATEAAFLKKTLLGNFEMTPEYRDAFAQTLRDLHRDGVRTAVVLMPVSATYLASHPGGAATYERWKHQILRTARAEDTLVIDSDRSMPESAFSDYVHLTPEAARSWSATLAGELKSLDCRQPR
jgi:hypothetical protein